MSFKCFLNICYVSVSLLGVRDTSVSKTDKILLHPSGLFKIPVSMPLTEICVEGTVLSPQRILLLQTGAPTPHPDVGVAVPSFLITKPKARRFRSLAQYYTTKK